MSYAQDYTPGTSFANDEENNVAGRSLVKTDSLDSELANISTSINDLNENLQSIQRDDNKLKDSIVEPYALSEQTRALIAVAGCNPRGTWATNTDYAYKDVIQRNNIAQICLQAHNSGSTFTQSFWLPISGDGTSAANAAAAAASAASALSSQASAAASATASVTSAAEATTAKINAETAATNALNSALSSATSASNAEDRAVEAESSASLAALAAASITSPVSQEDDPTHSSTSDEEAVTPLWVKELFGTKINMQVFDTSGTFTAQAGVKKIKVTVIGGGGGAGGSGNSSSTGGGGAGGVAIKILDVSSLGGPVAVTVGNGGAGGSNGSINGSNGQSSSFGSFCSASGGNGSSQNSSAAASAGGAGGIGSGGDINIRGQSGGSSSGPVNGNGVGGVNPSGFGRGADGRLTTGSGAAGSVGAVIVEW